MSVSNPSHDSDRSVSRPEQSIAESLLPILNAVPAGTRIFEMTYQNDSVSRLLSALENFIPEVLRETHGEWKWESLDAVFPLFILKSGPRTARIPGECLLISDQTLITLLVDVQVSPKGDHVNWFECRLGLRGPGGMIRRPYEPSTPLPHLTELYELDGRENSIPWMYHVGYGLRVRS